VASVAPPPATTVIDSALFRDAFGTPRMREVFSDRALVSRYIEAEVALARAEARCGVIPAEAAEQIAARGLSVRETERLVQEATRAPRRKAGAAALDTDARRLQEELSESLGANVLLKPRRGGRGSVVIDYSSLDELQGIVTRIKRR